MATHHTGDLRALSKGFREDSWPDIACPACRSGTLHVEGEINAEESQVSRSWRELDYWEPDFIQGPFQCALRCDRSSCGEAVMVSGDFGVEIVHVPFPSGDVGANFVRHLKPKFFIPPIRLVASDESMPESLADLMESASAVLWVDTGSAANRVRSAVEELLNLQRVPKTRVDDKKKRHRRTAHSRIELLRAKGSKYADAAHFLMAVKWIGNDGSHGGKLTVSDVLSGAEFLNRAVELIYNTSATDLKRRADAINKRRGVPRKRVTKRTGY